MQEEEEATDIPISVHGDTAHMEGTDPSVISSGCSVSSTPASSSSTCDKDESML